MLDEVVFLNNWVSFRMIISDTIYKGAYVMQAASFYGYWWRGFIFFIYLLTNISPLGKASPN